MIIIKFYLPTITLLYKTLPDNLLINVLHTKPHVIMLFLLSFIIVTKYLNLKNYQ
jgi:hypothetical protein